MNMQDFIDFIRNDDMRIIERDSNHVVIKCFDVCMEYTPCSGTGQFSMAAGDIDTFDYDDYIESNICYLDEFKTRFLEDQKQKVIYLIRKNAPYIGRSTLLANTYIK
jgi:hypothetical protein